MFEIWPGGREDVSGTTATTPPAASVTKNCRPLAIDRAGSDFCSASEIFDFRSLAGCFARLSAVTPASNTSESCASAAA